jgi:acetyl-CoA carboxylase, biotin carboxylase subunit
MHKVLVANRGEIAVRIIRACREMGLATVAVYSEADADALHPRLADERILLGPADPRESYLNPGRLIDAARHSSADAVHPGYGFLSESADFAAAVQDSGCVWIGPPPAAIGRLGDKISARSLAKQAGVPDVPGFAETGASDEMLIMVARRLGMPVLIKAAAGGGGRGMRLVEKESDVPDALRAAHREADAAFGSGELLLEQYLPEIRHIEVQVLADQHGTTISLGERECSIQRRHQKIIEESPSSAVTPSLRARLSEAAIAVVRSAGYVNAGTVEFLVEPDGMFYFLEVNTRLQVEHPVTEATTGIDLVKTQIRIANGERLAPEPVQPRGHAIECRIYAEDPTRDFSPSPGPIWVLREPAGPGVRVDSGIRQGFRVPVAYDPLLSKVIVWDRTRAEAITRMAEALRQYVILGCRTNLNFLQDVIAHTAFGEGKTSTRFLEDHFSGWKPAAAPLALAAAAVLVALGEEHPALGEGGAAGAVPAEPHSVCASRAERVDRGDRGPRDSWDTVGPWRLGMPDRGRP